MPCVLFSSKPIYFAYCFVRLKSHCHELSQSRWEKFLVIRFQLRQGYLYWYIFRANNKFWADIDAFHLSLTIIDANTDIYALHKPHLKDITVQFFFMKAR